jgi:hypothetical protein
MQTDVPSLIVQQGNWCKMVSEDIQTTFMLISSTLNHTLLIKSTYDTETSVKTQEI